MKPHVLAAAIFLASAGSASAYTSFVLPADFSPEGHLRVEAGYASTFFNPVIGLPADMVLVYPDGSRFAFDRVEASPQVTRANARLSLPGTYRISTGERIGRVATMIAENDEWRELRDGEAASPTAQTLTLQRVTVADAFITVGSPTRQAVDRHMGTLALHPVTHPNQVLASGGFEIDLLFNGAPLANTPLVLYESGDADTDVSAFVVTDADGRARFTFDAPGRYVIAARYRADAPAGAAARVRSYTTTLTFEVLDRLPG